MITIEDAIIAINSSAQFTSCPTDDADGITWLDGTTPISKEDLEAKKAELQAEYDAKQWKRNRQKEYPNHEDCIHALLDGGDTLTDLQTKRTAVKDKYPKE
jgi:hypothetical protein|tara:strand:+ start:448 stop:750 length:303 start_codon:yes stop_codon:yes gene_type:complete